ncbi:MAG: BamA/OMP85 family outer membrane protein, partial [Bacteroidia bacterium]
MKSLLTTFSLLLVFCLNAQTPSDTNKPIVNYSAPREFTLVKVNVIGTELVDPNVVVLLSGLPIQDKIMIPGDKTAEAIDNLWREGLFDDVQLLVNKVEGDYIWLDIVVVEKPRINKFSFAKSPSKINKNQADDLREKLDISRGMVLTDYRLRSISETVNEHYRADGYLNCQTEVIVVRDTGFQGYVNLDINITKGKKVKIQDLNITGNTVYPTWRLRFMMKDTKQQRWYQWFKSAKYLEDNYQKDQEKILAKYRKKGYRDVKIVTDTVQRLSDSRVLINMRIVEGNKYYFRHITWVGNTKYSSERLSKQLGINRGDVYNQELLESGLYMSQQGNDISSLYMDDGYLFFQINPVEVNVEGDSIDFEIRIYEGRQATIRNVTVMGNTKTNDHVIVREIRTRPGQLFSRTDVIRSQRQLASLGYFDPE